jgi:predicted amidohydrolase
VRDVRVCLAQIAPKLGDLAANLARHREVLREARRDRAELVLFPELSLTGYVLRDQVPEVAVAAGHPLLAELARESEDIDLVVGLVEEAGGHRFYNAAAYFSSGALHHLYRKVYLPTYGLFHEGQDFAPGERVRAFEGPFGPTGLMICEDHWHGSVPWLLAQQGAELLLTIAASPTRGTRPDAGITSVAVWRELMQVTARFQTVFVAYVNRVGCEDGLTFGGGSLVIDPLGREVGSLPPLDEGLLTVELRADLVRRARTAYPLLRDEDLELMRRELDRLRFERFGLPAGGDTTTVGPDTPDGSSG